MSFILGVVVGIIVMFGLVVYTIWSEINKELKRNKDEF